MKKGRLIGCLALVASAFLWATAYIAVKQLVAEVPPSVLLAFRFSFAAIILAVICIPKFKHYTKDLLFSGMKMGTAMFFEFFLFTVSVYIGFQVIVYYSFLYYNTSDRVSYYKKKKTDRQRCTCICNLYGWNLSSAGKWAGFL